MSNAPRVSVIMPCYNVAKYVATALDSILEQSYADFECIVVDDCSDDGTWDVIQEYAARDSRIRAVRNEENMRICESLNRGLNMARGDLVARMDGDDYSFPQRLALQVAYMDADPKIVISGGSIEVCDEDMNLLSPRSYNHSDSEIREKIFRYSPFCHPAVIMQREAAVKVGGYNPAFSVAQDYDLYFRLGLLGKFGNLPDTLLKLRTRPSSSFSSRLNTVVKNTLFIRLKAVVEYGYPMSLADKAYLCAQFIGHQIIPHRLTMPLFNLLRRIH